MKVMTIAVLLGGLLSAGVAAAGVNDVPNKVQRGIEHFDAGEYKEAADAFAEAGALRPEDAKILFDMACAKAAAGDTDGAIELLVKAAVTDDIALAARCHYNLGQIAADRAKLALGEKPEEAEPSARVQALEHAAQAVGHWRDCLEMDPTHADARHNLELLRLWTANIQKTWHDRDRQKRRDSMKPAEFLAWLDTEQRGLRGTTKSFAAEPKSPKRHLAIHNTAVAERELSEEVEPLKQKIAQGITAPPACGSPGGCGNSPTCSTAPAPVAPPMASPMSLPTSPQTPPVPTEEQKKAIALLGGLADGAGESMTTAAEYLGQRSTAEAVRSQAEAVEKIDQIGTVLTPYPELVQRAVKKQEGLVGAVAPIVRELAEHPSPDLAETAWEQRFVERWAQIMVAKAKQGLKNMPPAEKAEPEKPKTADAPKITDKPEPANMPDDPKANDPAAAAKKQQEGLRKSMELAVEHGPKVQELCADAAKNLDEGHAPVALPKQEEALRLLKEIAKPLEQENQDKNNQDKQNQDQNKDQQNQDQKDQDKKDQDKKDQDKQNQDQKKDEPTKDQDKEKKDKDRGRDEQDQQPQSQKPQNQKQDPSQPQAAQPRDISKQQAEALARQVEQRQREKDKAEKALMEYLSRPEKVDKDW